jgi:hypothetical protein
MVDDLTRPGEGYVPMVGVAGITWPEQFEQANAVSGHQCADLRARD